MNKYDIESHLKLIQETFASSGLSKREVAARATIHVNTLRNLENPKWNPTARTISRLESVLQIGRAHV